MRLSTEDTKDTKGTKQRIGPFVSIVCHRVLRVVVLVTATAVLALLAGSRATAQKVSSPDSDAPNAPAVRITNGLVTAVLYLPDAERGYYRATRFDWSGVVADLQAGRH